MLHAIIMAGGSGTRFWPLSRTEMPKQLLNLAGDRTMIQMAVDRCIDCAGPERTWVVTNHLQAAATGQQLPEVPGSQILKEPAARNTAPCIGLAAMHLVKQDPDAIMLLMPADHVIQPISEFTRAVETAQELIRQDPNKLVLFGVPPTFPSTGFGYIERGEAISAGSDYEGYQVASFREKPDYETASKYVDAGSFLWNCGIFVWRADRILELIATYEPEIYKQLETIQATIDTPVYDASLSENFPGCPSISIDYGVLERADSIAVVEAQFEWDDVGSWQALHRLHGQDENGNTVVGDHLGVDTTNCIVRSEPGHLVATLGIKDCIVVQTPDATYVADKQDENAIKQLIELLKERGLEQYL